MRTNIPSTGGAQRTVTVTTNSTYTVGRPPWLSLEWLSNGFRLTAQTNNGVARSGTVTVRSGSLERSFSVNQLAGAPNLRNGDTIYRLTFPSGADLHLSFNELVERFGASQANSIRQSAQNHGNSNGFQGIGAFSYETIDPNFVFLPVLPPLVKYLLVYFGVVTVGVAGYYVVTNDALVAPNFDFPSTPAVNRDHASRHVLRPGSTSAIWTSLTTAQIEDELEREAGRHGIGQCEAAAAAMAIILKRNGRQFESISIQFPSQSNVVSMMRVVPNLPNQTVSTNGFHTGILFNGLVRCNVHPAGLPLALWLNDFLSTIRSDIGSVTPVRYQTIKVIHNIFQHPLFDGQP